VKGESALRRREFNFVAPRAVARILRLHYFCSGNFILSFGAWSWGSGWAARFALLQGSIMASAFHMIPSLHHPKIGHGW
jgi:hypothetical protein